MLQRMVWLLLACALAPSGSDAAILTPEDPGLSPQVLAAVRAFPETPFYWPSDDGAWWGTPDEVRYLGFLLSPADPDHRGHCVGATWEIAVSVLEAAAGPGQPIGDLSPIDLTEMRRDWFVRELGAPGASDAVTRWGVGVAVDQAHLVPGDFVQLWYAGGGGHSGVFTGWASGSDGTVTGITYWSVHPALGRAGEWTDPLGEGGVAKVYGARLAPSTRWRRRTPSEG